MDSKEASQTPEPTDTARGAVLSIVQHIKTLWHIHASLLDSVAVLEEDAEDAPEDSNTMAAIELLHECIADLENVHDRLDTVFAE